MIRDSESLPLEASRDKDFVETYDILLKHLFLSKQAGVTEEISVSPQNSSMQLGSHQ